MIWQRLELQNIDTTTQKWNEEILEDESVKDLLCINEVKHRQPHISRDMNKYEQHRIACDHYTVLPHNLERRNLEFPQPRDPQPRGSIT